jgi:hypothetical protein
MSEPVCTRPGDLSSPAGVRLTVTVYLVDCLAHYRKPSVTAVLAAAGCKTKADQQRVTAEYERRLPDLRAAWRQLRAWDKEKEAGSGQRTALAQGSLLDQ